MIIQYKLNQILRRLLQQKLSMAQTYKIHKLQTEKRDWCLAKT